MAHREVTRVAIEEVQRPWQAGEDWRRIATGTGLSRNTVGSRCLLTRKWPLLWRT